VNPLDFRGLQNHFGLDFHRSQGRGCIGGEVWIAGTGGKDDNTVFLEMPDGSPSNEHFSNLSHLDPGQHALVHAHFFKSVLNGKRVDDGRKHSHVVCSDAIKPFFAGLDTSEDITAADHDCDLDSQGMNVFDFCRNAQHHLRINSETLISHQS